MPQNLPLKKNDQQALTLDDDLALLRALADLVGKAPQIAQLLRTSTDLASVLAAVKGVVGAADYQTLATWLGNAADASGVLPKKYQGLLETIHDLAGDPGAAAITWSIATAPSALPANAPGYSLNLNGSATLSFNAADKWPDPTGSNDQLLSVKADGKIDVGGSATVPFDAFGKLTASGDVSFEVTIAYYFKPAASDLYCVALVETLLNLADPYDLASVWGCFGAGLQGVVYTFTGDASAQVQVMLADAVKLGAGVEADIGAKLGVAAGVSGKYSLTLYKSASPSGFGVKVKLGRDRTVTTDTSGSVGLNTDLTPLVKPFADLVATAATKWQAALNTIKPFLSPGTWLQQHALAALTDKIKAVVSDQSLQTALIADAQGALGTDGVTSDALSAWLLGKVGSALDYGSALVDGDIAKAVERATAQFGVSLPSLTQAAIAKLQDLAGEAITEAERGLEAAIGQALARPEKDLVAALTAAGTAVNGVVNDVNAALAPVRDLLNKIDSEFQNKILAPVQQALKQKVTAQLTFDDSLSTGTSVEIDGVFTEDNKQAEATFHSLATGNLSTLAHIIDGAAVPGFELDADTSAITRFSNSKNQQGVDVTFLGIELTGSEILSAGATLVDGAANVRVNTQANLAKTYGAPLGGARAVSFVETATLVQAGLVAKAAGVVPPVIELGASASYAGSAVGSGPIADFIERLRVANLISQSGATAAHNTFSSWSSGPGGTINGAISANLRLAGDQIQQLLQISARAPATGKLSDKAALAIIHAGLGALAAQQRLIDNRSFSSGFSVAVSLFRPPAPMGAPVEYVILNCRTAIAAMFLPEDPADAPPDQTLPVTPPILLGAPAQLTRDYLYFLRVAERLLQLVELVQTMGDVYTSKASPAPGAPGWDADKYRAAQETLLNDSVEWVTVFSWLLGPPAITPTTIAFLRTMADLAGPPNQPAVMLTLTDKPATGDPKTASFG